MELDVTLVEWPDGRARGGPRVLGRTSDPGLVARVRECLAEDRLREVQHLRRHPKRATRARVHRLAASGDREAAGPNPSACKGQHLAPSSGHGGDSGDPSTDPPRAFPARHAPDQAD